MCLTISIQLPTVSKQIAKGLEGGNGSVDQLDIRFDGTASLFGRGDPRLSISEAGGGGCACSMLTEQADWNAPAWDVRPELLQPLANTLAFISERAPAGFVLEALWAGDNPEKSVEISIDDLLDLVRENRMGTKTRYIVRPE